MLAVQRSFQKCPVLQRENNTSIFIFIHENRIELNIDYLINFNFYKFFVIIKFKLIKYLNWFVSQNYLTLFFLMLLLHNIRRVCFTIEHFFLLDLKTLKVFHYPSCTDSFKLSLQLSVILSSLMLWASLIFQNFK
jgi:hypothetical protein